MQPQLKRNIYACSSKWCDGLPTTERRAEPRVAQRSMHREFPMRNEVSFTALALTLLAGTTTANAQTVTTSQISMQPVETIITQQPVQTVQTVTTTRTVRRARPNAHRQVVTTRRTITSERVLTPTTVAAPPVAAAYPPAAYPPPLYDVAAPAPAPDEASYPQPVYDEVVAPPPPPPVVSPLPALAQPVVAAPGYTPIPTYRYVYEPDRILVIDPATNIAVQALPR